MLPTTATTAAATTARKKNLLISPQAEVTATIFCKMKAAATHPPSHPKRAAAGAADMVYVQFRQASISSAAMTEGLLRPILLLSLLRRIRFDNELR